MKIKTALFPLILCSFMGLVSSAHAGSTCRYTSTHIMNGYSGLQYFTGQNSESIVISPLDGYIQFTIVDYTKPGALFMNLDGTYTDRLGRTFSAQITIAVPDQSSWRRISRVTYESIQSSARVNFINLNGIPQEIVFPWSRVTVVNGLCNSGGRAEFSWSALSNPAFPSIPPRNQGRVEADFRANCDKKSLAE